MTLAQKIAGLDVSKDRIEVCLLDGEKEVRESFGDASLLANRLARAEVDLAVLEPTGGYERALVTALHQAGIRCAVVNARHVRHFARAAGVLAKTDRLDARILAEYGRRMSPEPTPPRPAIQQRLCDLVRRRRQLVDMRKAEQTRLQQAVEPDILEDIEATIAFLAQRIKGIEQRIRDLVSRDPGLEQADRILRSMPGIGVVLAATLLAELPELGSIPRRKIAALAGLAPLARDSGNFRGARSVWGGRADLRSALHMGVIAAIRHPNPFRDAYVKLRERGKPHKVATTAILRKMVVQLNAMIRDNGVYQHSC